MSQDVEALVKQGIKAYKANNKEEARQFWEQATELDQFNETAWLWLSEVVETLEDKRTCLENVLFINPENKSALKGLEILEKNANPPESAPPARPDTPAPVTATSSASSNFVPDEPTAEQYDAWLDSLNLSAEEEEAQQAAAAKNAPFSANVFDESSFGDDDDDIFADPFGDPPAAAAYAAPAANDDLDSLRDVDNSFADSGPFAMDAEDDFENFAETGQISRSTYQAPTRQPSASSSVFMGDDDEDVIDDVDEPDPGEYFRDIPRSIKATRLPGTDQGPPRLLMMTTILLVVLNVGAGIMLAMRLLG